MLNNTGWKASIAQYFEGAPELVLLDLDGTLIDSVPDLASAVDTMLMALGQQPAGEARVRNWVGNGADRLIRRALCDGDEVQAQALAKDVVAAARPHFDRAYLEVLHQATGAFAGVEVWLQQCSTTKVLITNKPRQFTLPLLESLGWSDLFQAIYCGDDLPEKKPSPLPLLAACEQCQVSTDRAIMIGDSKNDIEAAKAAGIASVAVTYGYNHGEDVRLSEPEWVIDAFSELSSAFSKERQITS